MLLCATFGGDRLNTHNSFFQFLQLSPSCNDLMEQAYLRHIPNISLVYIKHFKEYPRLYLKVIVGITCAQIRHISDSDIFLLYHRHISGKSQPYLNFISGFIPNLSQAFFRCSSAQSYLRHISDKSHIHLPSMVIFH